MESRQNSDIAIFDICDTLFDSNTTFDFLHFYLSGNKRFEFFMKTAQSKLGKIFNGLIFRAVHKDMVRLLAIRFLRGKSKAELKVAAESFYTQSLERKMRADIIALLGEFKARGVKIYLVSATLDFIAEIVNEKLKPDDSFSTQLSYEDGICIGKIRVDLLGQKDKLLKEKGISINHACIVTDNLTDYSLVKDAKTAYIIAKKRNLKFWNSLSNIEKTFVVE